MQGANKRTGRLPKKPKPAADEAATDELATVANKIGFPSHWLWKFQPHSVDRDAQKRLT